MGSVPNRLPRRIGTNAQLEADDGHQPCQVRHWDERNLGSLHAAHLRSGDLRGRTNRRLAEPTVYAGVVELTAYLRQDSAGSAGTGVSGAFLHSHEPTLVGADKRGLH